MVPTQSVYSWSVTPNPGLPLSPEDICKHGVTFFGLNSGMKYHRKSYFMVPQEGTTKLHYRED